MAFGHRERGEEQQYRERLEEDLAGVVVVEPHERVAEKGPREQCEDGDGSDRGEAIDEPAGDEVRRDRDQRAEDGGHEEHHAHRSLLAAAGDGSCGENQQCGHVVPHRPELADVAPEGEAGPCLEGHGVRVVFEEEHRFAIMIPRVVAAEEHLAADDEVVV